MVRARGAAMKPLDWLKPEAIGVSTRMVAIAVMRIGRRTATTATLKDRTKGIQAFETVL